MEAIITVRNLNESLKGKSVIEKLKYLTEKNKDKVVFTTSFGYEDQVITDMIFTNGFHFREDFFLGY